MVERGVDVVVGEANVRFRAPARFDDVIALHARIAKLGTTSVTLEIEIRRDDELLVEGWLRQVFVDAKTWQKTEIPDWVREALASTRRRSDARCGAGTKRSASTRAALARSSTRPTPSPRPAARPRRAARASARPGDPSRPA